MYSRFLALFIGLTAPAFFSALAPTAIVGLIATGCLILYAAFTRYYPGHKTGRRLLGGLTLTALASCWSVYSDHALLNNQLRPDLAGRDLVLAGRIDSMVSHKARRVRFVIRPLIPTGHSANTQWPSALPARIQLSWYHPPAWARQLQQGDSLQVTARLKRPRSFANPGGFDYKLWQLRRGVGAQGYVRRDADNKRLDSTAPPSLRARLGQWLKKSPLDNEDLLQALLLGDRSAMSDRRWQVLRATGTNHLVAISGLHIGLAAGFGYLLGLLLGRFIGLWSRLRAPYIGLLGGALAALQYSALAGFSLPTQRALTMLLLFYLARFSGRQFSAEAILMAAALAVCALDPLAIYGASFWLSFLAVGALVAAFSGVIVLTRRRAWGRLIFYPQWVVFIGLALPLGLLFQQLSLVSPVANVVAIALVSFLTVPLLLLAALSTGVNASLAYGLLWLADKSLDGLWYWLSSLIELAKHWQLPASVHWSPTLGSSLLVGVAALCWLLPRALTLRLPATVLVVFALFLPKPVPAPLVLRVLDVGQGLAVIVQAGRRTLIYDTGPYFSASFDAGSDIIVPYLRQLGIDAIDTLVVSHGDSDHAGGAAGLARAVAIGRYYRGEPLRYLPRALKARGQNCHHGQHWQWQQVRFSFISTPAQRAAEGNNASCVLVIRYHKRQIILPGDIERELEPGLIARLGERAHTNVLLAPHHGSASSSTPAWVAALKPDIVVFSAGYHNRYGHPRAPVVARYRRAGSRVYNTATSGALIFRWSARGPASVYAERRDNRYFWYD